MASSQPIPIASTSRLPAPSHGKRPLSPNAMPPPALKRRETVEPAKSTSTGGGIMARGFYIAYIDAAFVKLAQGNAADYQSILNVFTPWLRQDVAAETELGGSAPLEPPTRIRSWLDALVHAMPRIDSRAHVVLIETVLSITWTALDESCIGPYIHFVAALLGAKPEFVGLVVKRAVKGFHYSTGFRSRAAASTTAADVTRRLAYDRIHRLLRALVVAVPTLPPVLWHQVNVAMPPKRESKEAHIVYLRNALRVVEYCPTLVDDLLASAVTAAITIDAEIQCEIADFEDDAGKLDQEVFGAGVDPFDRPLGEDEESDGEDGPDISFDDLSSDEGRDDAADENTETLRKEDEEIAPEVVSRLKDLAAKLDAVLKVIFEFLERMQLDGLSDEPPPPPSPPSDDEADARSAAERATVERRLRVFDVLIAIFERTILSTFKTQHTQFLLFWAASLDPALTGRFTYFLLERALYADDVPTVTRVASACYLASFISRAQFVDTTAARKVMAFLLEFVGHHLDDTSVDPARGGALVQQHAVFYAAVQAAFYIFCFRWRDLVVDEGELGRQWMPELSVLQRAVTSPYNPLKICSSGVCTQFAHVARATEFMYCFTVLEANRRSDAAAALPDVAGRRTASASDPTTPTLLTATPLVQQALHEARMDSHFPFDPYKLPLTAPYLEGRYRIWQAPDGDDEDDDEDEDEDEDGHTMMGAVTIPGQRDDDDDRVVNSFEAMSLSPEGGVRSSQPMSLIV